MPAQSFASTSLASVSSIASFRSTETVAYTATLQNRNFNRPAQSTVDRRSDPGPAAA